MGRLETDQMRADRMERNKDKRPIGAKRIHNNRKGQPVRFQKQQQADSENYRRRERLGYNV